MFNINILARSALLRATLSKRSASNGLTKGVSLVKALHLVTFTLLVVGGLNWLVWALFDWELGKDLLGGQESTLATVVYVLVGLSAVYEATMHGKHCKMCKSGQMPSTTMPGQM